jgi:hypothetical protein
MVRYAQLDKTERILRMLTVDQHADIAMHLHAADHHMMKAIHIICASQPNAQTRKIVKELEKVRDWLGAASSASRHSANDTIAKCEKILLREHPEAAPQDIYYGMYADCAATLALEVPFDPDRQEDEPDDIE